MCNYKKKASSLHGHRTQVHRPMTKLKLKLKTKTKQRIKKKIFQPVMRFSVTPCGLNSVGCKKKNLVQQAFIEYQLHTRALNLNVPGLLIKPRMVVLLSKLGIFSLQL